jgi:hypothetical protein
MMRVIVMVFVIMLMIVVMIVCVRMIVMLVNGVGRFVLVICLVRSSQFRRMDDELRRPKALFLHLKQLQAAVGQAERSDASLNLRKRCTGVDQGAESHVAADAAGAIEVANLHGVSRKKARNSTDRPLVAEEQYRQHFAAGRGCWQAAWPLLAGQTRTALAQCAWFLLLRLRWLPYD